MKKYHITLILLSVLFVLILIVILIPQKPTVVEINGKKIYVEIADSDQERTQGLMFRNNLEENKGMLYVFPDSRIPNFWMRNTLIPLDIIFIKEDLEIADIKKAYPCTQDPCSVYLSSVPVMYVLEVNSNYTEKNNIQLGQKIIIK